MENYIENTFNWYDCDNIVHPKHNGQAGLLHLGEPCVFILMKDYESSYWADFDQWKNDLIEVNFLYPEERAKYANQMDNILTDAWNFMILQERKQEEMFGDGFDDEF